GPEKRRAISYSRRDLRDPYRPFPSEPRMGPKSIAALRGFPIVVAQHSAQTLASADLARSGSRQRHRDDVIDPFVIPVAVVGLDVLATALAKRAFAARDDLPQALLDRLAARRWATLPPPAAFARAPFPSRRVTAVPRR